MAVRCYKLVSIGGKEKVFLVQLVAKRVSNFTYLKKEKLH